MRALLIGLILAGPALAGGVYKWTDAQGNVHFGDKPPDTRAERVQTDDAPDPATPGAGLRPGERAMLERREEAMRERMRARQESIEDAERAARVAGDYKEYCYRLRLDLQEYQDERRRGCSVSECQFIDRRIAYHESLIREHCR